MGAGRETDRCLDGVQVLLGRQQAGRARVGIGGLGCGGQLDGLLGGDEGAGEASVGRGGRGHPATVPEPDADGYAGGGGDGVLGVAGIRGEHGAADGDPLVEVVRHGGGGGQVGDREGGLVPQGVPGRGAGQGGAGCVQQIDGHPVVAEIGQVDRRPPDAGARVLPGVLGEVLGLPGLRVPGRCVERIEVGRDAGEGAVGVRGDEEHPRGAEPALGIGQDGTAVGAVGLGRGEAGEEGGGQGGGGGCRGCGQEGAASHEGSSSGDAYECAWSPDCRGDDVHFGTEATHEIPSRIRHLPWKWQRVFVARRVLRMKRARS